MCLKGVGKSVLMLAMLVSMLCPNYFTNDQSNLVATPLELKFEQPCVPHHRRVQ